MKDLTPGFYPQTPAEALIFVKTPVLELVNELVQAYADKYTSVLDPLLAEVAEKTAAHPQSHMASGHVQGKMLEVLSLLVKPQRILEIGTFTGFSALCLAKGLQKDGKLHTIELRKEEADLANGFFKRSVWKDQIILHLGNALEIIPGLRETWDLVFIDADKVSYVDYYKLVLTNVRQGGLIIADNVLFHGEVLEPGIRGKNAIGIQAFNDFVNRDESVDSVLLTVRDGLTIIRKK